MPTYLYALAGLAACYLLYALISRFLDERHHARRADELGCKPTYYNAEKLPFGINFFRRITKADKAKLVPQEFEAIYKEHYRSTWYFNIFGTYNLSTVDPRNIQALLATQFDDFEIGPLRRAVFFPIFGNGIFTSDGRDWEHSRTLLRPQFARDQVGDLDLLETHVQNLMQHLPSDASTGWTPATDLAPLFFGLTLDSATEFLFGQSVNSQIASLPDIHPSKKTLGSSNLNWAKFGPAFDSGTYIVGQRARMDRLYFLYYPKHFRESIKIVHEFADYYVDLALRGPGQNEKGNADKDKYVFLQELVKSTRDPVELRSQLLNILLAGRDTTAGLLGYVFLLLSTHPRVFATLRQQILQEFGPYHSPLNITFSSLKSCSYLQHTLAETLRLCPSVPSNSRRAVRDTTLPRGGGPDGSFPVYVRRGQEVNYLVHVMHRRKDLWGDDAEQFRPERWVGRKAGWDYLPFNGGPRICLGQQFSLTEAGYVVVRICQRFEELENVGLEAGWEKTFRHQYSVTTAPEKVVLRLREATT